MDGGHGTDVPKSYKKCTCLNGRSDRKTGSGLEVMLYKRLSNGEALLGVICASSLPIALWPQALRSLIVEQWPKEAFNLTCYRSPEWLTCVSILRVEFEWAWKDETLVYV